MAAMPPQLVSILVTTLPEIAHQLKRIHRELHDMAEIMDKQFRNDQQKYAQVPTDHIFHDSSKGES